MRGFRRSFALLISQWRRYGVWRRRDRQLRIARRRWSSDECDLLTASKGVTLNAVQSNPKGGAPPPEVRLLTSGTDA